MRIINKLKHLVHLLLSFGCGVQMTTTAFADEYKPYSFYYSWQKDTKPEEMVGKQYALVSCSIDNAPPLPAAIFSFADATEIHWYNETMITSIQYQVFRDEKDQLQDGYFDSFGKRWTRSDYLVTTLSQKPLAFINTDTGTVIVCTKR